MTDARACLINADISSARAGGSGCRGPSGFYPGDRFSSQASVSRASELFKRSSFHPSFSFPQERAACMVKSAASVSCFDDSHRSLGRFRELEIFTRGPVRDPIVVEEGGRGGRQKSGLETDAK